MWLRVYFGKCIFLNRKKYALDSPRLFFYNRQCINICWILFPFQERAETKKLRWNVNKRIIHKLFCKFGRNLLSNKKDHCLHHCEYFENIRLHFRASGYQAFFERWIQNIWRREGTKQRNWFEGFFLGKLRLIRSKYASFIVTNSELNRRIKI